MINIPTYDEILQRMLDRVDDSLDKRQGSIIFDALAPAAVELAQMYITLDGTMQLVFIETSSGEYLDLLTQQNGVFRKDATYAIREGVFNIEVPIGSRFRIQNVTYVVTELISGTNYKLRSEEPGSIGNSYFGSLTPLTNIEGLQTAELTNILQVGDDVESDEQLKARYVESVTAPQFGGNISDYKVKVSSLEGVGGVKVFPIWDGGGTVKLVITDSNGKPATPTLKNFVQEQVDPTQDGSGLGIAPIGHRVTVDVAKSRTFSVKATLELQSGTSEQGIKNAINDTMEDYFNFLNGTWSDATNLTIRTSQIESRILDIPGVVDITSLSLKEGSTYISTNIILNEDTVVEYNDNVELVVA